ncbi:MAG: serine protease [Polyangiales bacterium]|nr:trypsin-like peptidase domain-containing protein [Myxococcales bacterium]MCB9661210.1 trypsin-like peptidase domain-containing protein [Sandaracinaceae bacterium]
MTTIFSIVVSFAFSASRVEAQGAIQFSAVDAATVRVFAVENVGTEEVQTPRGTRLVAIPNMGHGSGFAVTGGDRLILTAAHVVANALYVVVRLPGEGAYFPARVVYRDEERDVAVLEIAGDVPPLELQPPEHTLRTRQNVFAVGYPLDASRRQAQSSRGIVGGLRDDGGVQLDMDVNPGNSGGPVIDESDRVVGMVVSRGDVTSGVAGLAVAVPLATLHDALREARQRVRDGRVPVLPTDAQQAAHVIDTLSRVGLMRILREASDVTEGTTDTATIQQIRALDVPGLSADMKVFVAAFLWDAAQMLMHRAGQHVSPSSMPEGATRALADELLQQARALLQAAAEADPTVADRSPFVRATSGGAAVMVASEALRPFADAFPVASAVPLPEVPAENWHWRARPTWALLVGFGVGTGGFLGGRDTDYHYGLRPLPPGPAFRVFAEIRLTPSQGFSFVAELDYLGAFQLATGEDSTPGGWDSLGEEVTGHGGGLTLLGRIHPGGYGFFAAPAFRIGAQRFSATDYRGDTESARFRVVQPGLEAGVQLQHAELSLRGLFGIPTGNNSNLYTIMFNVAIHLVGAR